MAAPVVRYRAAGRDSEALRACSEATAVGEAEPAGVAVAVGVPVAPADGVGEVAGCCDFPGHAARPTVTTTATAARRRGAGWEAGMATAGA
jgi:hypothetical protein